MELFVHNASTSGSRESANNMGDSGQPCWVPIVNAKSEDLKLLSNK